MTPRRFLALVNPGLASLVTAALFLVAIFFAPLAGVAMFTAEQASRLVGLLGRADRGSVLCFSSTAWQVVQAISACVDAALVRSIRPWQLVLGKLFPFVDILDGAGTAYTSIGSEPFTPNNELRYNTFQVQDNFTWNRGRHTFTFGGAVEKYHSDNVFFNCCKQGAWVYNTIDDFFTDARDALANPNRTTSPVTLSLFQVRGQSARATPCARRAR